MVSPDGFMIGLCVWRLVKWAVRNIVGTTLEPIPLPIKPKYHPSKDVSLIVPTIGFDKDLIISLKSWLSNDPKEIIIVTSEKLVDALVELVHGELSVEERRIVQTLSCPLVNKRRQVVAGIQKSTGEIIVFADDDVFWPPLVLTYILAGFETDENVGAVGGFHRARRQNTPAAADFNGWEALAARRLWLRKIDVSASVRLDGGIPCISGRTAAYRAAIVQDRSFQHHFTNEYWLGLWRLNSGDDQFMIRWVVDHGWNVRFQAAPEAEIETTVLLSSLALLVMATYLPASLGHLTFALDQPWFWKHIPIQFAWGTASMFLSAYTLATLHETSWGSRRVSDGYSSPAFDDGLEWAGGIMRLVGYLID